MSTETTQEAPAGSPVVGTAIREARIKAEMTQDDLAAALGVTQTCVSYWENARRDLGVTDLLRAAAAIGVPVVCLLGAKYLSAPEPEASGGGGGYFAEIAFMGRIEYTGYVTQVTKHGQAAYHIDLPEKLWGGNPLAWVEHAASAWFSERPMTGESVRRTWETQVRRAADRARQEAEWRRMQEQRAIEAAGSEDDDDDLDADEDRPWGAA